MRGRRAGVTRAGVVIVLALGVTGGGFALAGLGNAAGKANRSKCSGNLRQLGLAALQAADDRRYLPHLAAPGELGGDVDTSYVPRTMRWLVDRGYLDGGYAFVCPSSNDEAVEPTMHTSGARWTWGALRGQPPVDPTSPEAADPTLAETTELSYGWTRRRLGANARSTTFIAADRAVREADAEPTDDPLQGNHVDGMSALQADATVLWISELDPARDRLTAIDDGPDASALAIAPRGRARAPSRRGWWQRAGLEGLALVPLGLGGLVLLLRGEPLPSRRAARVAARPQVVALEGQVELQLLQRCPYCHDGVEPPTEAGALTRCTGCSAVFHAECVPHGGACTTLACPGGAA